MDDERWERGRRPGRRPWAADLAPEGARSLADWVERLLMQVVILGLVALVLVQALWAQPALRKWAVLADRLEGVDWASLLPHRAAAREVQPAAAPGLADAAGAAGAASATGTAGAAGATGTAGAASATGTAGAAGATGTRAGNTALAVSGQAPAGQVTVMLITRRAAPGARLLVDGEPVGDFRTGTITVRVAPGQRLTIDARAVKTPLTFRVVAAGGLKAPPLGAQVTTEGNEQVLGVALAP